MIFEYRGWREKTSSRKKREFGSRFRKQKGGVSKGVTETVSPQIWDSHLTSFMSLKIWERTFYFIPYRVSFKI